MSSEVHKYIEEALDKKQNLFNAEVINFPNDKNIDNENNLKMLVNNNEWKISNENNADQLRAVTGICLMFVALILMGLYSNFF
mgnify:CR=1 FL=1